MKKKQQTLPNTILIFESQREITEIAKQTS